MTRAKTHSKKKKKKLLENSGITIMPNNMFDQLLMKH
jgi:hypothetical protein